MPSPDCQELQSSFSILQALQQEFALAYQSSLSSQDLTKVKELKAELEVKLAALQEQLNPLEKFLSLKEQYQAQKDLWQSLGILESLSTSQEGIRGINNQEYPFPSYQEITKKIRENKDFLQKKAEQGFTRLILVPFGLALSRLTQAYQVSLLKHFQANQLFFTRKDPSDPEEELIPITKNQFNETNPLWVWEKYQEADQKGDLVYFPQEYSTNHQGKSKGDILTQTNQGWQILLLEDLPNLPKAGSAQEKGGRKQLDNQGTSIKKYIQPSQTIPSPREYLQAIQEDPQYYGESGLTPEDWLAYALTYLEEKNQIIDDWQGNSKVSYNLGGYFPASDNVPNAYWYRDNRQASLGGDSPGNRNVTCSVRSAVRV